MDEIEKGRVFKLRNRITERLFPLRIEAAEISLRIRNAEEIEAGGKVCIQLCRLAPQLFLYLLPPLDLIHQNAASEHHGKHEAHADHEESTNQQEPVPEIPQRRSHLILGRGDHNGPEVVPHVDGHVDGMFGSFGDDSPPYMVILIRCDTFLAAYHLLRHGENVGEITTVVENRIAHMAGDRTKELDAVPADHPGVAAFADADVFKIASGNIIKGEEKTDRPVESAVFENRGIQHDRF